jgi:hypothetical protein
MEAMRNGEQPLLKADVDSLKGNWSESTKT